MKKCKLLLFDLDGTLLQSDKTMSSKTLLALKKCKENDILIGVSTSRSEQNSLVYLNELMPDILISSGGALVKYQRVLLTSGGGNTYQYIISPAFF